LVIGRGRQVDTPASVAITTGSGQELPFPISGAIGHVVPKPTFTHWWWDGAISSTDACQSFHYPRRERL